MTQKFSITDLPLENHTVLLRVDFNVPLDEEQKITDETRILASLPSIKYIIDHGGAVVLMSHLGRPKGKHAEKYSLAPCAKALSEAIGKPVQMAPDCVGDEVAQIVKNIQPGQIVLLENLRFHAAEENPDEDPSFAEQLAQWGDFYVNDAFGTAHRAHSSTTKVASYFPGKAAAGFLLQKEIEYLGRSLLHPKQPFYAIIGGAKISSKMGVLRTLLDKAHTILIGGGMAYTFLKAMGHSIGRSIHEDTFLEEALSLMEEAKAKEVRMLLPIDVVVANQVSEEAVVHVVNVEEGISPEFEGVDIGPKTTELFVQDLYQAQTIFWNGPLGVFECPPFAKGTYAVAQALVTLPVTKIIGGGDSVAAVKGLGIADKMTHISTGGGASLEYIEKGRLPSIEALSDKG